MTLHKLLLGVAATVGILAGAATANAAFTTVTWSLTGINDNNMCDLSSSSGDAGTPANPITFDGVSGDACSGGNPDNSYDASSINQGEFDFHRGNVLTFESTSSSDNVVRILQAAAFSVVDPGPDASDDLQTAVLANYSPGLGVIDSEEVDEGSPEHTVDNNDFLDFVVFRFGEDNYDPLSIALSLFGDGDIEVFIGGTDAEFGSGNGFGGFVGYDIDDFYNDTSTWTHLNRQCDNGDNESGDDCSDSNTSYILDAGDTGTSGSSGDTSIFGGGNDATGQGGALGRYMVIAARDTGSPLKDKFKIKKIVGGVDETQTPEPMTIALLGAGLVGLGAVRRRKAA